MIYRCILPRWAKAEFPDRSPVREGQFSDEEVEKLNKELSYNIYFLPNAPTKYTPGRPVEGADVDKFNWVFVDMDLKDGIWASKEDFISAIQSKAPKPTMIIDSGGGVHAYWRVSDLDAMSYLRLSRRMMRKLNTDEAVGQLYQLMRLPGTVNTKNEDDLRVCEIIQDDGPSYTCEELDSFLPPITVDDETYCNQHYERTHRVESRDVKINDKLPAKFGRLLEKSKEARDIWIGNVDDRSVADMKLGHLMFTNRFTREEATAVLVNASKAISRSPRHRLSYAQNIVDKIWTFEIGEYDSSSDDSLELSQSVSHILAPSPDRVLEGERLYCEEWLDNTHSGFRLGHVIGLVAGVGVGKTAMALNMFLGFVRLNPNYDHFFVTLEQPANEIAERWQTTCEGDTALYDKVHIISNYNKDGSYRNLSLDEIREYLVKWQKQTSRKIGCVVIDHIGILRMESKTGENQRVVNICHQMKSFAIETNTLLVMQSQAPREKAGIGDLPLDKDAAYGTVFFEAYCDYLITIWQPLKRCYVNKACPAVMAFKFCKIRHKKRHLDTVKEDVNYRMYFDTVCERLRPMTEAEDKAFNWFLSQATQKRKLSYSKTEIDEYKSTRWDEEKDGKSDSSGDPSRAAKTT